MKVYFGIVFTVFSIAELYFIVSMKRKNQLQGFKAALISFSLILLLTLIIAIFDLKVYYVILLLATLSIFLNSYIGYFLDYYVKFRVVDRWLHAYGTFALALLFYNLIILFVQKGGSKLFQSLFVFFLGITLSAIFEIMEFMADSKRKTRLQPKAQKGLRDTDFDIIFNVIGAAPAAIAAYFFMT